MRPVDVTKEQAEAIDLAEKYGLGAEVEYAMFECGMSPNEALAEQGLTSCRTYTLMFTSAFSLRMHCVLSRL